MSAEFHVGRGYMDGLIAARSTSHDTLDAMPREDFVNALQKSAHDPKFKTVDEIFGVTSPSGEGLKEMNRAIRQNPSFVLRIPYERADVRTEAKKRGAKWDPNSKTWRFKTETDYNDVKSLLD